MAKNINIDFSKVLEWYRAQPRYVLYGGGCILLGVILLLTGLILL